MTCEQAGIHLESEEQMRACGGVLGRAGLIEIAETRKVFGITEDGDR
jgi:hypothetical protein